MYSPTSQKNERVLNSTNNYFLKTKIKKTYESSNEKIV